MSCYGSNGVAWMFEKYLQKPVPDKINLESTYTKVQSSRRIECIHTVLVQENSLLCRTMRTMTAELAYDVIATKSNAGRIPLETVTVYAR